MANFRPLLEDAKKAMKIPDWRSPLYNEHHTAMEAMLSDPGRMAQALGYDAIYVSDASIIAKFGSGGGGPYMVVLNRGAMTVARSTPSHLA